MAHYILADDFDFDSIIIKDIAFDLVNAKLSLTFTYNDDHTLTTSVDFAEDFATTDYVDTKVANSLKDYSTTSEVGEMIATALNEYDKSDVVTNKINESIANALNDYYNKTEIDNKNAALKEDYVQRDKDVTNNLTAEINKKAVSGVENKFSTDTNALTTKVYQADGTYQTGIATIPNGTNSTSGLISAAQTKKLNNIEDGANKYVLPLASESALGGVMAETGDDNYTVPVKRVGNKLYTTPGQYDLKIASPTVLGGVKPTAVKTTAYTVPVAVDSEGGLFTIPGNYELPQATASDLGGIKIGYTENNKNYAVKLDSNGKAYVNVPWTDTTYTLPVASASALGGIQIGYAQTGKNYPVQLSNNKAYVNVPWSDTVYTLPTATTTVKGGVKTDGQTTEMNGEKIQVKVDGTTIIKGSNGLEAAIKTAIFPNWDDVLYNGKSTSTIESSGVTFSVDCVLFVGGFNYFENKVSINGVSLTSQMSGPYCNASMYFVKANQTIKVYSDWYFKVFSLTN